VVFSKTRVRTLKPDENMEGELILAHYGRLKPGRYEIRAKYDVAKNRFISIEFGMTPLQFERTVMILYVEK